MKHLFYLFITLTVVVGCNFGTGNDEESNDSIANFDLEEISEAEADSMSLALMQDTVKKEINDPLIQPVAARRGASEKQWRILLKDVFENVAFKNPVYFGVSNRKGIGTILDKKQEVERELSKLVNESTYKTFLTDANSGPIQAAQSKDFNFNLLLNANALGIDAAIASQITRSDSSKLLGGSWEIYDLVWGTLKDSIKSGTNPSLKQFADDLNNKKNVIVSKVAKITGFKSEIYTSSNIGAELKAKIDTTIGKIQNASGSVKFTVINSKTILAESTGHFYVFGVLSKKKVN
jgi:hypothetical protein